ncbi:MAG TPA: hypothetical protein VJP89_00365 [Pyrinomonadaceae bacterium]|nr:hypothetical protein [Pyrinomonadaceae bacterium]
MLDDIPFEVSIAGDNEFTLSSGDQQTPWDFLLRIDTDSEQMFVSFTLNHAGLSVSQALTNSAFYEALVDGGTLRIHGRHPITGGDLIIASGTVPSGQFEPLDARLIKTLQRLAFIEEKTGISFYIPHDNITSEVCNTIAATADILKTGRAKYDSHPWISISPIEQARNTLEMFAAGHPAAMAVHFEGQVVPIFNTHVMLGPVTLFFDRTYITAEDLADLRKQLQHAKGEDTVKIRFTPFEDCIVEARYVNWLPEDEAKAVRQLPMYQKDNTIRSEDPWAIPNIDVANAISLLESWYDEDEDEQKASWNLIKAALERDRLSDRKLFP